MTWNLSGIRSEALIGWQSSYIVLAIVYEWQNFCRWVADVPLRETSPSAKSKEKGMFSQATDVITKAVFSSQLFKDPEGLSGRCSSPQPPAQQSPALSQLSLNQVAVLSG